MVGFRPDGPKPNIFAKFKTDLHALACIIEQLSISSCYSTVRLSVIFASTLFLACFNLDVFISLHIHILRLKLHS